ncbi:hypothetical protein CVT24_006967 [Panaeolus cyanescens]|uniref:Lysine-specific metallo-endopeptidase domain-containing protein n=1 Tax=Panaeolus cyanescens TaxID=181874 RepID=A0A409YX73_9AGAR|nr:hypothetical protein CVT24_006967 [Panaeolus cyanescens]
MFGFIPTFQVAAVAILCSKHVLSAPTPTFGVVYRGSTPAFQGWEHGMLDNAVEGAARHIMFMKTTIENARKDDAESIQKIKDVFGEQFNLDEIENTANALDSGVMKISSWRATFPDSKLLAAGSKAKHAVTIGREFYNGSTTPDWLRIGTLIHEATHLLSDTTDSWEWSDDSQTTLVPVAAGQASDDALQGQWDNEYDLIKEHAGGNFHKNADTWFVFGYHLEYGTFPPHNPPFLPSTRRLQFVDIDHIDYTDPDLLTFGPSQWFALIPDLAK